MKIQNTWTRCSRCGWDTFMPREGEVCRWCDTKATPQVIEVAEVTESIDQFGNTVLTISPIAKKSIPYRATPIERS